MFLFECSYLGRAQSYAFLANKPYFSGVFDLAKFKADDFS